MFGLGFLPLLREQATPLELVMFVVVAVIGMVVVAFLIYLAAILLIWAVRLKKDVTLYQVFFPTAARLREFWAEYLLALATSAVVMITLAVKHDLVDQIRNVTLTRSEFEQLEIAELFPLHRIPDSVVEASDTVFRAEDLLLPALKRGRYDAASVVVRNLLPRATNPLIGVLGNETVLRVLVLLLVLIFILRLAKKRYDLLRKPADVRGPFDYGKTAKSVFILSLCLALLLATPSILSESVVTKSTLASVEKSASTPVAEAVDREIRRQNVILEVLYVSEDVNPTSWAAHLTGIESRLGGLAASQSDLGGRLSQMARELASVAADQATMDLVLSDHGQALQSLGDTLVELLQRVGDLEAAFQSAESDLDSLIARVTRNESRIDLIQASTERLDGGLADVRREIERIAELFSSLPGDLQGTLNSLTRRVAQVEERTSEGFLVVHSREFREPFSLIRRVPTTEPGQPGMAVVSGVAVRLPQDQLLAPTVLRLEPGTYSVGYAGRGIPVVIEAAKVTGVRLEPAPIREPAPQ